MTGKLIAHISNPKCVNGQINEKIKYKYLLNNKRVDMINAWMNEWKIQTLKCTILKLTWQVPSVLFVQVCNEASAACGSSASKKKFYWN